MAKNKGITCEQRKIIIELYLSGIEIPELAEKYDVSKSAIYFYLHKDNVDIRPVIANKIRREANLTAKEYRSLNQSWRSMNSRCYEPKNASYETYSKKGIQVCTEWKYCFENFLKWSLANGWEMPLTLDRIDNDGDYSPENCRWVDMKAQCRNRSTCIYLEHNGETKALSEWCEFFDIAYHVPYQRLKRGCSDFDTLFLKVDFRDGGDLYH